MADDPWAVVKREKAEAPQPVDDPWAVVKREKIEPSQPEHGWFAREAMGAGAAAGETFGDTMLGAQELVGHALRSAGFGSAGDWLISDAQAGAEKLKGEAAPYRKAAPTGAFVGDIAGAAPVMALTDGIPGGVIGRGAASGAIAGGLQPTAPGTNYATQKARDVTAGAAGGAVGGAVGGVIAPQVGADAARLMSRGVQLTPGQMIGGVAKRAEDALASVPVVGSFIGGAQRKSVETFNRAVIDDALAPIGEKLPASVAMGHDAVAASADKISDAYQAILPRLTFRRDAQFDQELGNLRALATSMGPDQARQFDHIISNYLEAKMSPTGTMLGDNLKIVEADLGKKASQYNASPLASEKQLGDAIREAQHILRTTLERQNPTDAPRLQAINAAFARQVRVEAAANNRTKSDGIFTPADLLTAIKRNDTSARDSATARGRALGQQFALSGERVLPNKTPNSGTPERAMWASLLGGEYFQSPHIALGLGGATLPYTQPVLAATNRIMQPAGPVRQTISDQVAAVLAPSFGMDAASVAKVLGANQ